MPSDNYRLGVHVDQVRAKLLAGINFEQVHADLMVALDGIAAGKGHCDFVEIPRVRTTTTIFDVVQRRSNSFTNHSSRTISTLSIEHTPNSARPVNRSDKMKLRQRSSKAPIVKR